MSQKRTRVIKRYQNRKLYDTVDSCYVTLDDISELIRMGEDVEVIDNHTKEDLTAVTLAQIILEEQKKKTNILPLSTFKEIIQSGSETLKGLMHKIGETGAREFEHVRHFVDDKVKPTMESLQQIPNVHAEINTLRSKIKVLEKKLAEHEKLIQAGKKPSSSRKAPLHRR
jgi:polyhydroxyalkanoate synthesis repressor PhaR